MKSAYELAMERLNRQSPTVRLSAQQKRQIAELDSRYAARLAERDIALKGEIADAVAAGKLDAAETLQQHWVAEKQKLKAELEEKKEAVRTGG
jgi:hypothetical protein